jgi:hypothetical protein
MRQMLHIFRKDVRGLVGEIAVFVAVVLLWLASTAFGPEDTNPLIVEGAVILAACYLTARAVHADNPAGDRAFWKTRPYRWWSLVAGKLLVLIVFVHVPLFGARAAILRSAGFEILPNLSDLLVSQLLLFLFVSVPTAAVAALTPGLVSFIPVLAGGVVVVVRLGLSQWGDVPPAFGWVQVLLALLAAAGFGFAILCAQYRRWSTVRRGSLVIVGGLLIVACRLVPFDFRWAVQSMWSRQPSSASALEATLGPPLLIYAYRGDQLLTQWPPDSFEGTRVLMYVGLGVKGLPVGTEFWAEHVRLNVQLAGETVHSAALDVVHGLASAPFRDPAKRPLAIRLDFPDGTVYEKLRNNTVTLKGTIYFAEFGDAQNLTVPLEKFPVNVRDSLGCSLTALDQQRPRARRGLVCKTAFRDRGGPDWVRGRHWVEYTPFSPLPSLRLNPLVHDAVVNSVALNASAVDFTFSRPVSYASRDFEIRDVRLVEDANTRFGWRNP